MPIKTAIKSIIVTIQLFFIKFLLKKHFYDEIEFFSKASIAPKDDVYAERSLFRTTVHHLDKKLLSDDKKDQMIKIVHNTIQNVWKGRTRIAA